MKGIILVVDDDSANLLLAQKILGGEYRIAAANSGPAALKYLGKNRPDVILLDLGLPDMDGAGILSFVREWSTCPIIVVSARNHERDKVDALDAGADDYIVKPFEVIELLARIDVVMRRYKKQDMILEVGGLRIDTGSMQVWREGAEISLTKTEYELLLLFARNPRRAMYRETIYERVWGGDYPFGSKAVDLHVQRLRKKVGWETMLRAVNKVGYRLEA